LNPLAFDLCEPHKDKVYLATKLQAVQGGYTSPSI
jgi:hypothetical protein